MKLNFSLLFILSILAVACTVSALEKRSNSHHGKHLKKSTSRAMSETGEDLVDQIPAELPDVAQNGMHTFGEIVDLYKNHHVTLGEIKQIFKTADLNEDNQISGQEWGDFHGLFIEPFEEADGEGDYLLGEAGVQYVLQSSWLDGISSAVNEDEANVAYLVEAFDRWNQESKLNFADYLFLRKANLAWKECSSEKAISSRNLNCALHITSPGRILQNVEAVDVYRLACVFKDGKLSGSFPSLNFIEFLGVSHLYYYFTEFELPFQDGMIDRKDVIRAIEEASLPTVLTPGQVMSIFTLNLEKMDFKGFGGSLYAFRLFTRFSKENSGSLSQAEWNEALNIPNFNQALLGLIDNLYMPTQEELQNANLWRLGERPKNEKDYIVHFLQKSAKNKKHRHHKFHRFMKHRQPVAVQDDDIFDDAPRDIIYRMFDSSLSGKMTYADFQHFFKYAWMFQNYDSNGSGYVTDKEVYKGQGAQLWVIGLDKEEYRDHEEQKDWLGGNKDFKVNLKEFCAWFRYRITFSNLRTTGMQVHAIQWRMHQGFKHLGFRLAKFTENVSHDGYNNLLGEREFHFKQAVIDAIEDEVIALAIRDGTWQE